MKPIKILFCGLALSLLVLTAAAAQPVRFSSALIRGVWPSSDLLTIASDAGRVETNGEAAYGAGVFVTVYESRSTGADFGDIFAAVLTDSGDLVQTFPVVSGQYADPAVAYEAGTGLFLIVFETSSADIGAVTFAPDSGVVGDPRLVEAGADAARHPAVDCNSQDQSCLVAFEQDNLIGGVPYTSIQGRFMDLTAQGVSDSSPPSFPVTTTFGDSAPDVVWGEDTGTYLVTFTWYNPGTDRRNAVFSHVYDVYLDGNSQTMHATAWMVPADMRNQDSTAHGAAYDPYLEKYLTVFTYDALDDQSNHDIYFRVIEGDQLLEYALFVLADTADNEIAPAIAFDWGSGLDQLLVVYTAEGSSRASTAVLAAVLQGNKNPAVPDLTIMDETDHVLVKALTGLSIEAQIAGSGLLGPYFITLDEKLNGEDAAVFGRLMDASREIFLPLTVK